VGDDHLGIRYVRMSVYGVFDCRWRGVGFRAESWVGFLLQFFVEINNGSTTAVHPGSLYSN
jgi:hypothetical protein